MPPGFRRSIRARPAVVAVLLAALLAAGCGAAAFDPSGPCTADGRAAGAYPTLEALVPRELDGNPAPRVDSGRSCTPGALASLASHGVKELRYAGSTWETGPDGGVSIAVFEAPGSELKRTGSTSSTSTAPSRLATRSRSRPRKRP